MYTNVRIAHFESFVTLTNVSDNTRIWGRSPCALRCLLFFQK